MRKVRRDEIVDYVTYSDSRDALREAILKEKALRRIHVGKYLTFLFENTDTVRYQIQEMIRAERIVKETDIVHEINTYNELLGGDYELGCTLLIEIVDPSERAVLLERWQDLPSRITLRLLDGSQVKALFDERQISERRLSSVQYLRFPTGGKAPVALVVAHGEAGGETLLTDAQRAALAKDLGI